MSEAVPEGWEIKRLCDLVTLQYGKSPKEISASDGRYPIIGTGGVAGYTDHFLHEGNTTVIGRKGTIDKPSYVGGRFWAIDTTYYGSEYKGADPKWFYYSISEKDLTKHNEASGVPSLGRDTLYAIPVLTPPIPEQQKIATILSSVDNVIEKTRAQIDKLKDLKTGMMQELLTQGIGHPEFKDSPVGRIPKDWFVKTLGETAAVQRGHDLTQANSIMGRYPVVSSSGVSAMHDEYTTQGPGVVVGRKGSIGRVHYIQSDFWAHDTSLYVTNFHGNDVLFIYQLFSWLDLQKYGTKSGSPSLNRNDLHPIKLAIPPVAEQIEIREVLKHVDERTCLLCRKLSHLTSLKKALMQDLLTGKVRVNVDQKESEVA